MIPKIIHYCWLSNDPQPEVIRRCIASWHKYLPDYEIRLWNMRNLDYNAIAFTREALANKKWAFVSDYVRLYALYHEGEEIMRFWKRDDGDADFKMRRYHFPIGNIKSPGKSIAISVENILWRANLKVQKTLGIKHLAGEELQKTDNWKSLTERASRYLVENKKAILKKYHWSLCGDEYYGATELLSLPGSFNVFDCSKLLYVEFVGDSPRTFGLEDYQQLRDSGFYWARKFKV